MPKYGVFDSNSEVPTQEFEGDYMAHQVCIYKRGAHGCPDEQVAIVHLRDGQCLRQMEGFSERGLEPQSKIMVGLWLLDARETAGKTYTKFRSQGAKIFRKSEKTLDSYVALAQAVSLKFAKSDAVRDTLFPIWSAEGCFDWTTGELKPIVDQAIEACGGIPEGADSVAADEWARQFLAQVDALVRNERSRYPLPSSLVLR